MTPRQARLGADIFTGAVIASVGIALAGLTWRLMGESGTASLAPAGAVPQLASGPVDVTPIIALAPFGAGAAAGGELAQTSLPLVLKGILLADPRAASSIFIASGAEPPKSYRLGETVGGATIDAVARDHVVLLVGGRREMLGFPRPVSVATVAAGGVSLPQPAAAPALGTALPPSPITATSAPPAVPSEFGEAVAGGGFRIGSSPPAALQRAGLQPGDVVESVNGMPAGDLARDRQLLAGGMLAGNSRVEVVRGGRRITLNVSKP